MHTPIQLDHISLLFPHKTCFEDFKHTIFSGDRIAIIGRNGIGKSTLLRMIAKQFEPSIGEIRFPPELAIGYVAQILEDAPTLSGSERFQQSLSHALSSFPDLLLLDEPSNHLDHNNRRSLLRMLSSYTGTLILATHDVELLQTITDTIWHIDQGNVHVFHGSYLDYRESLQQKRISIENELALIQREKQHSHLSLMREQSRAKQSRIRGEKHIQQSKWPTIVSASKMRNAQETSGRKKSAIRHKKADLITRLSELRLPEVINPKFRIAAADSGRVLVSVQNGSVGYNTEISILSGLNFFVQSKARIAIHGKNGSGKSTLIKAILNVDAIIKNGSWEGVARQDIGYLDQHYATLSLDTTVLDTISNIQREWSYLELRSHLNDFLFRKNEEVAALVSSLSGGEKARLSLAYIAANSPKLLILDEVTNNLDLETRAHVIQVLKKYPGAMIVISHDSDFLAQIDISEQYMIHTGTLQPYF